METRKAIARRGLSTEWERASLRTARILAGVTLAVSLPLSVGLTGVGIPLWVSLPLSALIAYLVHAGLTPLTVRTLRIVFFGTPEFAVPTLERLIAGRHDVVAVVSQPDRGRGRGRRRSASPVSEVALREKIALLRPETLNDPELERSLREAAPDLGIICDVALDPYNSLGHDGLVRDGVILNDETVEVMVQQALVQAAANKVGVEHLGCRHAAAVDVKDDGLAPLGLLRVHHLGHGGDLDHDLFDHGLYHRLYHSLALDDLGDLDLDLFHDLLNDRLGCRCRATASNDHGSGNEYRCQQP